MWGKWAGGIKYILYIYVVIIQNARESIQDLCSREAESAVIFLSPENFSRERLIIMPLRLCLTFLLHLKLILLLLMLLVILFMAFQTLMFVAGLGSSEVFHVTFKHTSGGDDNNDFKTVFFYQQISEPPSSTHYIYCVHFIAVTYKIFFILWKNVTGLQYI